MIKRIRERNVIIVFYFFHNNIRHDLVKGFGGEVRGEGRDERKNILFC